MRRHARRCDRGGEGRRDIRASLVLVGELWYSVLITVYVLLPMYFLPSDSVFLFYLLSSGSVQRLFLSCYQISPYKRGYRFRSGMNPIVYTAINIIIVIVVVIIVNIVKHYLAFQ